MERIKISDMIIGYKLIKIKDELTLAEGNSEKALSIRYSVPEKLISLWLDSAIL